MKRVITTGLALLMLLSCLLIPASAYTTPDFTDVPQSHWAYKDIMSAADLGHVKGVGQNEYAPSGNLTTAAFLAMMGRSMYNDGKAETSTWWEIYYDSALKNGIIMSNEYTKTADAMNKTITRNEMARILVRIDTIIIGNPAATNVDNSKITDYATIPTAYQPYVSQAYAKNLLQGDANGNFNGTESLDRAAAATVMMRLVAAKNAAGNNNNNNDDSFTVSNGVSVTVTGAARVNKTLLGDTEAGVKIFLVSKADGSILGKTVSGEDGKFSLTASLKANQFIAEVPAFFLAATYTSGGISYTNIIPDKSPNGASLTLLKSGLYGDNTSYMHPVGVIVNVYSVYPDIPAKFS